MTVLTLSGKLTVTDANARLATLRHEIDALPPGEAVRVDATALTQADSSALAVLLALRRHCAATSRRFEAAGLPPRLAGLAKLYGVAELV